MFYLLRQVKKHYKQAGALFVYNGIYKTSLELPLPIPFIYNPKLFSLANGL